MVELSNYSSLIICFVNYTTKLKNTKLRKKVDVLNESIFEPFVQRGRKIYLLPRTMIMLLHFREKEHLCCNCINHRIQIESNSLFKVRIFSDVGIGRQSQKCLFFTKIKVFGRGESAIFFLANASLQFVVISLSREYSNKRTIISQLIIKCDIK